jgi:hypothetical protein
MAKKTTAVKNHRKKEPAAKKPAEQHAATVNAPLLEAVVVTPAIKITGVGFQAGVVPIGQISDQSLFDLSTYGSLYATGAVLGCPSSVTVTGQLIGLDTNFTIPGTVTFNTMRTRWQLIVPDNPPNPPGPGTYTVALEVSFPAGASVTPADTAEFMVTV